MLIGINLTGNVSLRILDTDYLADPPEASAAVDETDEPPVKSTIPNL